MNKVHIGNYITKKRKTIKLTQEQLAEKLGISSKTISKWENGKTLPDYSLVEELCKILKITSSELFNGEDNKKNSDKQIIEMLERVQNLENQKNSIFGTLLIILGIACLCMSTLFGGSSTKDFISGFLLGLSIVEMLVGLFIISYSLFKKQ